ncbi:MAG: hypothetical protein MJ239_07020 [Bacilli bacterium]|nr:hypothetical protein [Bacilli bacterium]
MYKIGEKAGSLRTTAVDAAAVWGETYIAIVDPALKDISEYGHISNVILYA